MTSIQWLGRTLAFARVRSYASNAIYLLSVNDSAEAQSEPRRLALDQQVIFGFDWTSDGRYIVFSSGREDSTNLSMIAASGGEPEPLVGGENAMGISISRMGNRLLYTRHSQDSNIWRIPGPNALDKNSAPTRFIASTRSDELPRFSPDGKKIAFYSARSGHHAIWVCDRDGLNPVELVSFEGAEIGSPHWSPDSRWIAFDGAKTGNVDIYVISADGGAVRQLTKGPSTNIRPTWSRDGSWIYFGSNRSGDLQIWKVPSHGGVASRVTKKGGFEAFESFDGKFVYYVKEDEAGIWKLPVAGGEEIQVLNQGQQSFWTLTERGIYFGVITGSAGPVFKFYSFATRQVELVRQFPKGTRFPMSAVGISVSPDGQSILYSQYDQASSDLMLMENYR